MSEKPRVVVAMSGGVDSSLTAALLVRQGYDVIGATMQIWEKDEKPAEMPAGEDRGCCSLSAVHDARRVADKLGIPYYVLNFREMFQKDVVDYFIREYLAGKTPNPCIACNRYLKFAGFLEKSLALGASYVATGHYARISQDAAGRYLLRKGIDDSKDQSYALYHLTQDTLRHFLFPLGEYTKVQTREMAREIGLAVADKPDSQEICFIPDNNYKGFLQGRAPGALIPGKMVDTTGKVVGRHQGLGLYTIGQRKGLGLAVGSPLYVVAIDPERNEIVVGSGTEVFAAGLIAHDLNLIAGEEMTDSLAVTVKIRYSAKPAPALLTPLPGGGVSVHFAVPQRAVTPGQSVVFYNGDIVLGGGVITRNLRNEDDFLDFSKKH